MAGHGDNGVLLGMMASRRAQGAGTGRQGGVGMFQVVPLMALPVIAYVVTVLIFGGADAAATAEMLRTEVFTVGMPSGDWTMSLSDVFVVVGLFFLFIELVKSAGSGTATILNHGLSMLVFVVCMAAFLLAGRFGNSTFFLLTLMALMDTVAGFVVTIVAARRDLAVGGEA
jgi:hypothetical protein